MYKKSKHREQILAYLKGTKSHPTPEQVYSELKAKDSAIGIATVYRNLNTLCEMGVVRRLTTTSNAAERYDADISNHYHFVCEECGCVSDLTENEITISYSPDKFDKMTRCELFVYGVCDKCQK